VSEPIPGWDDPELAAMGQRFRDELRAEAEAYEALAARGHLRGRDLADVALELLHRGDVIAVAVGRRTFSGEVTYAAGDLLCLRTRGADVDLSLSAPVGLEIVERVRSGGRPRGRGPGWFKARHAEHEQAGTTLEVGCPALGVDLRGRLAAVAGDHVVVDAGGRRWYLGLVAVAYVLLERT
jgi:hypothetical protein